MMDEDADEPLMAKIRAALRANPNRDPLTIVTQTIAADADELAAMATQMGEHGIAARMDRNAARMDALAARGPREHEGRRQRREKSSATWPPPAAGRKAPIARGAGAKRKGQQHG
jgi:hypothetical protein